MTLFPALAVEVLRMVIFEVRMGIEQQLKDLEKRRKRGMRLLSEGLCNHQFLYQPVKSGTIGKGQGGRQPRAPSFTVLRSKRETV
jgi:hypothetical protein